MKKPGKTAYDGAILTFGAHPFENTLDTGSLQQILEQVRAHSPRVMLHVIPTVGELQEEQPFADLMENLLAGWRKIFRFVGTSLPWPIFRPR